MTGRQPARKSKAERLTLELRRAIAVGEYADGDFLPAERDLAERYATSRKTIGDALSKLAEEGLVVQARGRGTRVTTPHRPATGIRLIDPLAPNSRAIWPEAIRLLRGVEDTIAARPGYSLERFCSRPEDASAPHRIPESPMPTLFLEVHGLSILAYAQELQRSGLPAVVANYELDPSADISFTWTDHGQSMVEAVELLTRMGHRRIGYIGYKPGYAFYGRALDGYVRAMRHAGLSLDEALIDGQANHGVPAPLVGHQAAQRMLRLADPPTAIVAARDNLAEGAWHAVEEAGLVVGRDVSLVGYDDLSGTAEDPKPLTTFREPAYEMGEQAARLLLERIAVGMKPAQQVQIPADLVIRRSVGPVVAT